MMLFKVMRHAAAGTKPLRLGLAIKQGITIMLAPLATLAFLAALWLMVWVIADLLGASSGKIVAALQGRSPLAHTPSIRPVAVRISQRSRPQRALSARPRLRAAA